MKKAPSTHTHICVVAAEHLLPSQLAAWGAGEYHNSSKDHTIGNEAGKSWSFAQASLHVSAWMHGVPGHTQSPRGCVCVFCARGCVKAHAICTRWCHHMAGHTCVCTRMSQGRDVAAPQRDLLRISLLQAVSFLVNNNLFTQSWAHAELMLSAHVYDKTVDLSELSPTNRWGNWSTRTSHRAAALMPCS